MPLAQALPSTVAEAVRRRSLRSVLLWMLLPPLLLLALAGGTLVWLQWRAQTETLQETLQTSARELLRNLELELQTDQASLEALAHSALVDRGDWMALYDSARRVGERRPGGLVGLIDARGQLLFNTALPYGTPLPNLFEVERESRRLDWLGAPLAVSSQGMGRRAIETGAVAYSDLFYGVTVERLRLAVAQPVRRGPATPYALILSFPPEVLGSLTQRPRDDSRPHDAIVDGDGRLLASTAGEPLGQRLDPALLARWSAAPGRVIEVPGHGGAGPRLSVAMRSSTTGWMVVASVDRQAAFADLRRSLMTWLTAVLALVGLAAWGVQRTAGRLRDELQTLARRAADPALATGARPLQVQELALVDQALSRAQTLERERLEAERSRAIAEERAAAQAEGHRQLQIALQAGRMGFFRLDATSGRTWGDAALHALLGLPAEGDHDISEVWTRVHPDDHADLRAQLRRALASGDHFEAGFRIRREDGTRWLATHAELRRDAAGRVVEAVGVASDVTEQRDAEAALRDSEQRFRQLTEAIDDAFWLCELAPRRLLYASPAFRRLWGLPPADLGALLPAWRHMVHPEDRGRMREAYTPEVWPEQFELEYRIVLPDGSLRWVRDRCYVLRDAAGTPHRLAGVTSDVTEGRSLREQLVERTHALEDADRRKDAFLATLGHELRNPLASIHLAAELLARQHGDDPGAAELGDRIARQARHMARLIDDLLDVARITQGKLELDMRSVELGQVLRASVEAVWPEIEKRHHQFAVRGPEGRVHVRGDATRLVQVFSNLLGNAARYTPAGGRIELLAGTDAGMAVVEVVDNGPGLPPGPVEALFEPFAQGPAARGAAGGGLGIGLAVVRRLVQLHGGQVEAGANPDPPGARLVVRLPLREAPDDAEPAAAPVGRSVDVLLVDDNTEAADAMSLLLESEGHRVRTAYNGARALAKAARALPEVALLDIAMPGMDGYDLAQRIRGLPGGETVLLVAMTGYGTEADIQRSRNAGFDRHLVKPVEVAAVLALLAAAPPRDPVQPFA